MTSRKSGEGCLPPAKALSEAVLRGAWQFGNIVARTSAIRNSPAVLKSSTKRFVLCNKWCGRLGERAAPRQEIAAPSGLCMLLSGLGHCAWQSGKDNYLALSTTTLPVFTDACGSDAIATDREA